jgi:hypothetical protein
MMRLMRTTLVTVLLVFSSSAWAQVQINVQLPTITFNAPPPLVVVEPGIQVVEDYDDEVFFVDGWYWCRRGPQWYRTRDHHGGWVVAEARVVPAPIVRIEPGRYRRWRRGNGHGHDHRDDHGHGGSTTVVVDPPGPGKVKIKHKNKHH